MQCIMPNNTAYQCAYSIKRRTTHRTKPPLLGAQGHAAQHA